MPSDSTCRHPDPGRSSRRPVGPLALGLGIAAALSVAALSRAQDPPSRGYLVASDGVKIHYLVAGGGGPPVVLIHGYTANAQDKWFKTGVAPLLARDRRVVAIDCRGHGLSDKPHDPLLYGPQMAEDVVELMDHLGIERAHVHGFSMGGGIVTQLLARHQDRLITASYGGSGVREVDPEWIARVPADEEGEHPQEQAGRRALRESPYRDEAALAAVRAYPWAEGERGRIDLLKVTVPVLAINGELDRPNARTHRMRRELALFESHVLPGRGHLTTVGDEYTKILHGFLKRHDPATGSRSPESSVAAQGRWRRSPARWLEETRNPNRRRPTVAGYLAEAKKNPPPQEAVLFAGSATIWLWDLEKWFPEYTTVNRGFGGSQIHDSLFFAERLILPHRPSTIVMYAGDNDVWAGKPPELTALHFEEFIWKVQEALPHTQIVYISIRPSIARWDVVDEFRAANRLIQEVVARYDHVTYADIDPVMIGADKKPRPELFSEDDLHLSEAGYEAWTAVVKPLVAQAEERYRQAKDAAGERRHP